MSEGCRCSSRLVRDLCRAHCRTSWWPTGRPVFQTDAQELPHLRLKVRAASSASVVDYGRGERITATSSGYEQSRHLLQSSWPVRFGGGISHQPGGSRPCPSPRSCPRSTSRSPMTCAIRFSGATSSPARSRPRSAPSPSSGTCLARQRRGRWRRCGCGAWLPPGKARGPTCSTSTSTAEPATAMPAPATPGRSTPRTSTPTSWRPRSPRRPNT